MSRAGRSAAVVCWCRAFGCVQQRFRDRNGQWALGALVSTTTRASHAIADMHTAARFGGTQDSDEDSDSDHDDAGRGSDVPELNIDQLALSSQRPAPNPAAGSNSSQHPAPNPAARPAPNPAAGSNSSQHLAPNPAAGSNVYNCSPYHNFTLRHTSPAVLHMSLLTAILTVCDHTSLQTASWLLKSGRQLLAVAASSALGESENQSLNFRQEEALNTLPSDARTVINWFKIDPKLVKVTCCRSCFAMYPQPVPQANSSTIPAAPIPAKCINLVFPQGSNLNVAALREAASPCQADLYQLRKNVYCPLKTYAYQNLYDWLARLFSRPGVEAALETVANLSSTPFDPDHEASDIHDSMIWKQFLGPDGKQYTQNPNNLTFGLFLDGINPYGNKHGGKHASITFIVMVCYSLPLDMRYLPQNLFIVGIAPGPKEPSLEQTNWILRPIVEQLKVLWDEGLVLSQTYLQPQGRQIRAAILPFFADLPALRRALGFSGPTANRMCSRCLLTKQEITNLNPETWPPRDLASHREWAIKSRDAPNLEDRKTILQDHGVRYSVMLELPYWDILKYHVVDSMHNLLLGLLNFHCRTFWSMSDVEDEPDPGPLADGELVSLWDDVEDPTLAALQPPAENNEEESALPIGMQFFNRMEEFRSETDDNSFSPYLDTEGWDTGSWTRASEDEDKIICDAKMVAFINKLLPRINIPTWIKRALPVLGKASFGSLKADEWRNLFTIQLPLTLPVYWATGGPTARSLFCNFAHLVSMVNLGLKRTMTTDRVKRYRHHNLEYLKSSLILFPDVELAPNHHMSIHLADCLEKFGPVRAWWSFPMERLMGSILKAAHNNRLGQLEITFLTNFCRIGNLYALLSTPNMFPAELRPFIRQLQAFRDPISVEAETIPKSRQEFLDLRTLKVLIKRLNELFPCSTGAPWISSDEWAKKRAAESKKFLAVTPSIEKLHSVTINQVIFSTLRENRCNSVIALREGCAPQYGIIEQIFQHQRTSGNGTNTADTWLVIQPLLPCSFSNPFAGLAKFDVQLELRTIQTEVLYVVHAREVLAHCAWIKYKPREILPSIKQECIALVSLDR